MHGLLYKLFPNLQWLTLVPETDILKTQIIYETKNDSYQKGSNARLMPTVQGRNRPNTWAQVSLISWRPFHVSQLPTEVARTAFKTVGKASKCQNLLLEKGIGTNEELLLQELCSGVSTHSWWLPLGTHKNSSLMACDWGDICAAGHCCLSNSAISACYTQSGCKSLSPEFSHRSFHQPHHQLIKPELISWEYASSHFGNQPFCLKTMSGPKEQFNFRLH